MTGSVIVALFNFVEEIFDCGGLKAGFAWFYRGWAGLAQSGFVAQRLRVA
jgi:hypothetical protein